MTKLYGIVFYFIYKKPRKRGGGVVRASALSFCGHGSMALGVRMTIGKPENMKDLTKGSEAPP